MKTITEKQAKALAKMLPEKLSMSECRLSGNCIVTTYGIEHLVYSAHPRYNEEVLDTELLQLCWEVEETLTDNEALRYMRKLIPDDEVIADNIPTNLNVWRSTHAAPSQRINALAAVKGMEVE